MVEQSPFRGEDNLAAADLRPGDVVCFIVEYATRQDRPFHEQEAVILDVREQVVDALYLNPDQPSDGGYVETMYLDEAGLRPYNAGTKDEFWDDCNHTISRSAHVATTFLSRERAAAIQELWNRIDDSQARFGVTPTEPTIESLALAGFVGQALDPCFSYTYQRDKAMSEPPLPESLAKIIPFPKRGKD